MPGPAGEQARPAQRQGRALRRAGLVVGALAVLVALLLPGTVRQVPLGGGVVNLALVAGLFSLFLVLFEHRDAAFGHGLLVAMVPVVAAGVLARLLYMDPGSSQAVALRETALPEVGTLALALVLVWGLERWAGAGERVALGVAGGLGTLGAAWLLVVHVRRAAPVPAGAQRLLLVTVAAVLVALALQVWLGRARQGTMLGVLASGPGLAVAGAHLLDGVVSYLAVRDPLGLLTVNLREGVFLSRFILENLGPAFPLLKWLLGGGIVVLLEQGSLFGGGQADPAPWWQRVAVLLVVVFVGLGPGLFSSLRVLYA